MRAGDQYVQMIRDIQKEYPLGSVDHVHINNPLDCAFMIGIDGIGVELKESVEKNLKLVDEYRKKRIEKYDRMNTEKNAKKIIGEMKKCKEDPVYFYENYFTMDGKKPELSDKEKELMRLFAKATREGKQILWSGGRTGNKIFFTKILDAMGKTNLIDDNDPIHNTQGSMYLHLIDIYGEDGLTLSRKNRESIEEKAVELAKKYAKEVIDNQWVDVGDGEPEVSEVFIMYGSGDSRNLTFVDKGEYHQRTKRYYFRGKQKDVIRWMYIPKHEQV